MDSVILTRKHNFLLLSYLPKPYASHAQSGTRTKMPMLVNVNSVSNFSPLLNRKRNAVNNNCATNTVSVNLYVKLMGWTGLISNKSDFQQV